MTRPEQRPASNSEGRKRDQPGEERLTEAEWERRRAQRECLRGHAWQVLESLGGPYAVVCGRGCGEPRYDLVRDDGGPGVPPPERPPALPDPVVPDKGVYR